MNHLDYLIVVAEEKNLTKASQRLYISQPALTRYIQKLEEEYDVTLFKREHNQMILTDAGKVFLDEKTKQSRMDLRLREKLQRMKNHREVLSVGCGYERGMMLLPSVTDAFLRKYPKTDIKFVLSGELELIKKIERGEIDLAIGALDVTDNNINSITVSIDEMGLLIPAKWKIVPERIDPISTLSDPYIINVDDLDNLDFICVDKSIGSYLMYKLFMQKYNIRYRRIITTNSSYMVRHMVALGLGYGFGVVSKIGYDIMDKNVNLAVYRCTLQGLNLQRKCVAIYQKDNTKEMLLKEYIKIFKAKSEGL